MISLDEQQVRGLIDTFVTGWNSASGETIADAFHDDADFMAITGLRVRGRELIARGHDEILATIYLDSRQSADIRSVEFLAPEVAVATVALTFAEPVPMGVSSALLTAIATRRDGVWKIAVFRNMVPHGRAPAGPLEASLAAKAA